MSSRIGAGEHLGADADVLDLSEGETFPYREFFAPVPRAAHHPAIAEAARIVDECGVGAHPFFDAAERSRTALRLWTSQELTITGPFGQLVLRVAAGIDNVHVRSMVVEVARGEHGPVAGDLAEQSHPWLLERLRRSMDLPPERLAMLPETKEFLECVDDLCSKSPLSGLGALGMGSERLLLSEYAAVKRAFEKGSPDADYHDFLNSNLEEDETHAVLMVDAANALIQLGHEPTEFVEASRIAVKARMDYYDCLARRC